jgi:hypothetical protein
MITEAEPIFLEIFINADDFRSSGFGGRSAIEDEIDEALEKADLGEVTGGTRARGSASFLCALRSASFAYHHGRSDGSCGRGLA